MYCSLLLKLKGIMDEECIYQLDGFFAKLIGDSAKYITVSKVVRELGISVDLASSALTKCKELGILDASYAIRCPECNTLIKKINSLSALSDKKIECYSCGEEIEIHLSDIEVIYALSNNCVFTNGQQIDNNIPAKSVAREDTLMSIALAGSLNSYLFSPTEDDYKELIELFQNIKRRKGTTKQIGDSLENFTMKLFRLCSVFNAVEIKTSTNQIDCFVRTKCFDDCGVFKTIGNKFIIECKNENKVASGSYLSKMQSIINVMNAGGKRDEIKFGIIISKEKGPQTFKTLAVKYYLMSGVIIISIDLKEIEILLVERGNLLELLERKATEIITDSTTDFKDVGLYNA